VMERAKGVAPFAGPAVSSRVTNIEHPVGSIMSLLA
jgi:hypothetical protein